MGKSSGTRAGTGALAIQADALKLVAQKLQSSLAVEGDLPEDGLAAYGDTGDDLMMALARKLVSGNPTTGRSRTSSGKRSRSQPRPRICWSTPIGNEYSRQRSRWFCHPSDGYASASRRTGSLRQPPWPRGTAADAVQLGRVPGRAAGRSRSLRGRNPRPTGPSLFDWALEREQESGLVSAGG